jgi:ATP-dependent 26S proteasome regulatory subunit
MRNVCTEAGMAAIRVERDYAINEDFMQVRGVSPALFLSNVNIGGVR